LNTVTATILGQLPFLEVENVTLGQSAAVAMYLARELSKCSTVHNRFAG